MEKLNHRIELTDLAEHRELLSVKRNQHGDILFELEDGLTRQFTPQKRYIQEIADMELPAVEQVLLICKSNRPMFSFIRFQNPRMDFWGDIRDYKTPEKEPPAGLEIGIIKDRLSLVSKPENRKPAKFRFGRKEYFVSSGKAWDWVQNVILKGGFEGHPVETESASDYFKRDSRPFFNDLIKPSANGKYYIRTK